MADIKSISTSAWTFSEATFCGLLQSGVTVGISPGEVLWAIYDLVLVSEGSCPLLFYSGFTTPTCPTWQFTIKANPKTRSNKVRWSRILSNVPTTDMHRLLPPVPQTGLIGKSPCSGPSHMDLFASCCPNKNIFFFCFPDTTFSRYLLLLSL